MKYINLTTAPLTDIQIKWIRDYLKEDLTIGEIGPNSLASDNRPTVAAILLKRIWSQEYEVTFIVDGSRPFLLIELARHIQASLSYRIGLRDANQSVAVLGIPPIYFLWNETEQRFDII